MSSIDMRHRTESNSTPQTERITETVIPKGQNRIVPPSQSVYEQRLSMRAEELQSDPALRLNPNFQERYQANEYGAAAARDMRWHAENISFAGRGKERGGRAAGGRYRAEGGRAARPLNERTDHILADSA
ncbi:hypothetical protein EVAR_7734_1 [Eumeta japonica]|uniref:Uncharacterized protein n=1 Tax=Eumeta variegata TaxID=151549 RepID=A0A4C1TLH0_EUMVA|nr:hypothetical protein EVAR_7734_1 [Eumeta japonica]